MAAGVEERARLMIGGSPVEGAGPRFDLQNKYTLETVTSLAAADDDQIVSAVRFAHRAFRSTRLTAAQRGDILDRLADLVLANGEELVRLVELDAGFPAADGRTELARCIQTIRLSAVEARTLVGDMIAMEGAPGQQGRFGYTMRVPLGVVAAVTPFNAPLNTLMHKFAPAFAGGNAVVIKPSSSTPLTAFRLVELMREAGVPDGFVSLLYGGGDVVRTLLDQPEVRYIAFTGSTEVGRIIQAQAGLRKTQMELGSIAFTILGEDADLDQALPKVVGASYRKAGQVCTSIQMLLVHSAIVEDVTARLADMVGALPFGDPSLPETVSGPSISQSAAIKVEQWIDEAMARGATRLAGGPREGAVVPPTLLTDVDETMKLGCEEAFGPVMSIAAFDTLDEAIDRVNATPYGLASGIFTNRIDDAFAAASRLEVGNVHINETSSARVDLMPYGGSKDSGFGREGPHYAVREMTEERMISFAGVQL